jgi:hypothetical protein
VTVPPAAMVTAGGSNWFARPPTATVTLVGSAGAVVGVGGGGGDVGAGTVAAAAAVGEGGGAVGVAATGDGVGSIVLKGVGDGERGEEAAGRVAAGLAVAVAVRVPGEEPPPQAAAASRSAPTKSVKTIRTMLLSLWKSPPLPRCPHPPAR